MQYSLQHILSQELSRRLKTYTAEVEQGNMDRETANFRYMCLETAAWWAGAAKPHDSHIQPDFEVREEILRWIRTIQRETSTSTMHEDGRLVAQLREFLDETKAITKQPEQGRLL